MKKIISLLVVFQGFTALAQLQWAPLTSMGTNINNQRFDDVFFFKRKPGLGG
jgi:hypothetical protein